MPFKYNLHYTGQFMASLYVAVNLFGHDVSRNIEVKKVFSGSSL